MMKGNYIINTLSILGKIIHGVFSKTKRSRIKFEVILYYLVPSELFNSMELDFNFEHEIYRIVVANEGIEIKLDPTRSEYTLIDKKEGKPNASEVYDYVDDLANEMRKRYPQKNYTYIFQFNN